MAGHLSQSNIAKPTLQDTNRQMMYVHFPPEWHPQQAVMLTWPHADTDWVSQLPETEQVFINIAQAVCEREDLVIACHDENLRQRVNRVLAEADVKDNFATFVVPSNDTWARDHGPISVYRDGRRELLDFTFNAWGGKFAADLDNQISKTLHQAGAFGDCRLTTPNLVLEGGGIETDGRGTLLATSRCVFSPQRNPDLSRDDLQVRLSELLGIRQFLWLDHGELEGDDTDSHIDTLARFSDPHTLVYVQCNNPDDSHYHELQAMEQQLHGFHDADGQPYRFIPLPWPQPKYNAAGQRLPATYANFLIINKAVLVPTYRDLADKRALDTLAACFPAHEVIGIDCLPLIQQFGSLHCVTMQVPVL
jgi:agmatine deiminase